jgi:hypothetical protein
MSGGVGFLLIVVVISVVGSIALWLRSRKPTTFMSSVDEFQQEMRALGRDPGAQPGNGRRGARPKGAAPPPSRRLPTSPPSRRRGRGAAEDEGGGR